MEIPSFLCLIAILCTITETVLILIAEKRFEYCSL